MHEADLVLPRSDWYLDNVLLADERRPWQRRWAEVARNMDEEGTAQRLSAGQGFVLTPAQAGEAGVTAAEIRRHIRAGRWWQPRRGVLSPVQLATPVRDDPKALHEHERRRHAITATAAALVRSGQVISGRSASVLHGLPTLAVPDVPELTAGPFVTTGRQPRAHLWAASLEADDVTAWYGAAVTTVARTIVDCARHDRRDGIMAADAALHAGLVTEAELDTALQRAAGWPFVRRARRVVELADGRAESPLESITRLRIADGGLPVPDLQVWIDDPWTGSRYRVDGLWVEQRVVLEIDGRDKYSREELRREVDREHALRRLGYRIIRVMWDDVVRQWGRTATRIRAELASSPLV